MHIYALECDGDGEDARARIMRATATGFCTCNDNVAEGETTRLFSKRSLIAAIAALAIIGPTAAMAAKLGPIYPGAKPDTEAVSVQPDAKVYVTADALPNVAAWYAKHTPAGSEEVNTPSFALFQVGKTQIALHIRLGKTTIGLTDS